MSHPPELVPLTRAAILDAFRTYGRPREDWLIGGEFERHLLRSDGLPTPYYGEHGVRWLLDALTARGWEPITEDGLPIALTRDGSSVTLEPGGQFELSGAPCRSVAELEVQAQAFADEVDVVLDGSGLTQVALGFTPFARIADIPWVPKGRYVVMRDYLIQRGDLAHHMMKGTCAVQASYDYADDEDCSRKVRIAAGIAPIVTAMLANSPLSEGRPTGFMSWRGHVWTRTDPDRTGIPDAAASFTVERWIDYLLDVPMMFVKTDGRWAAAEGATFRQWIGGSFGSRPPSWADWELHMTSTFPEVRVKRQIEVRCADCVPLPLALGFGALFQGVFYCNNVVRETLDLGERFAAAAPLSKRWDEATRYGLEGTIGGRPLAAWAEEVLDLAAKGLERCTPDDRRFLVPLERQVESGRSPAARILTAWQRDPRPEAIVAASAYGVHPDPVA